MASNQTQKEKALYPLLQQSAALKNINHLTKKSTSGISLFGDPFERTDFSDFWKRSRQFLKNKSQYKKE